MIPLGSVSIVALLLAFVSAGTYEYLNNRQRSWYDSSSQEDGNYQNENLQQRFRNQLIYSPTRLGSLSGPIPVSFDARVQWPNCTSIGEIPDQGCCDASHVIAPTSVMTDRTCILSQNATRKVYSAFHVLTCCSECALFAADKCRGGHPQAVWAYWQNSGIVSGGSYRSGVGCMPYPFESNCIDQDCPSRCNPGFQGTVISDKLQGTRVYPVGPSVQDIQAEILRNGPVQTTVSNHLDLAGYKGEGVYRHRDGTSFIGNLSLKIIGWGVQDGTDYWLCVVSYGTGWGKQGTVKFLRGVNHLDIEQNVMAGIPHL